MKLIYVDETGDTTNFYDRYGKRPSEIFVLSSICINHTYWQEMENSIRKLREDFERKGILSTKTEFHTSVIANRHKPYDNISDEQVIYMFDSIAEMSINSEVKITSVIIDKTIASSKYQIFDRAATYLIRRLDKLVELDENENKYMLFCDQGYSDQWTNIARELKSNHLVKSYFSFKDFVNIPLNHMIEDPIPRDSKMSQLIQLADYITFITTCYYRYNRMNRLQSKKLKFITNEYIDSLMEKLKPVFNTKAHYGNDYGLVLYPKYKIEN